MQEAAVLNENLDFTKMKVPELKRELKTRGLSTAGNKTELLERLQEAAKSKSDDNGSAESIDDQVDDLDDDLLNDDDSDHDDQDNIVTSESVLKELDEQLDISPPVKVAKRPLENDSTSDSKPVKKIVLNRKPSISEIDEKPKESVSVPSSLTATVPTDSKDKELDDKKVIKLTTLSAKERLELRAKKFGTPPSVEAKKVARLERFGLSGSASTASPGASATPNLDILKKRAERFGGSVSKVMSSLEQQQRLELRKERFGNISAATCVAESDKAKQRLERFKTPVN